MVVEKEMKVSSEHIFLFTVEGNGQLFEWNSWSIRVPSSGQMRIYISENRVYFVCACKCARDDVSACMYVCE